MAIISCPECAKEVSDKAPTCPHCGMPLKRVFRVWWISVAILSVLAGGGAFWGMHQSQYAQVEALRAQQDAEGGTHDEHVRQKFYRLYESHPRDAMYIYLWARCVDDANEQLALAQKGIEADSHFAWNYNMASRALARLNRVPEAYDQATKGAALDPGNLELSKKQKALKTMIDHKLMDQVNPAPSAHAKYEGLFQSTIRAPDRADLEAIDASHTEVARGLVVCENPYSDKCVRVYVSREHAGPAMVEHQLVSVTGAVITNAKGENIILADAVKVESL